MKPTDDIQRLFKKAGLSIQPDADEQVFQDVLQARRETQQNSPVTMNRWRITMKNPITKLAVAAIIAVACAAGIFMWTGTGSGIVLADVLAQVQQITAYMYQMNMTMTGKISDHPVDQTMEGTVLIAQDYGMKVRMEMQDPNGRATVQEQYMVPQEKVMCVVIPSEKKYVHMDLDETLVERAKKQNYDPGSILRQILSCKYESLGRSTINGVEVEGFQTTDPNYLAGMMGQADVTIWVDVKTQLPVRMDMDIQMDQMHMQGVMDGYQWNIAATAADFLPVIPDDYTTLPGGPLKTPAMNEEGAIAGLKLLADLTGRYPDKLDLMGLMSQLSKITDSNNPALNRDNPTLKQLFEGGKGGTPDEQAKKTLDIMMPIQGAGLFYTLLVQEKKDPAYYGNVVTPQDADKVLLRWKLSDNQYRVIFGGLHAETVDAATLAELEKTLPK